MAIQGANTRRRRVEPPAEAPFRIGELSGLTGIPKQTIRFYVAEGLLPTPIKTSRNMGWYSPLHFSRLRLIQRLRRGGFLPLKTIRSLVEGNEQLVIDDDEATLAHLHQRLDSLAAREPAGLQVCSLAMDAEVEIGSRERAVLGSLDGRPSPSRGITIDPELTRHWLRVREIAGLSDREAPELLEQISDIVDRMIAYELELMGTRFRAVSPVEIEKLIDVVIPCLNKLFELLHLQRFGHVIDRQGAQGPSASQENGA